MHIAIFSGRSRISHWGGHRAIGGVPTSNVGAFQQKHMRKQKNWILLGGAHWRQPPLDPPMILMGTIKA